MPDYFVMGLPRSMTAWMANFLTYDGNYCLHEGMNDCHSLDEYRKKTEGLGDSGTGTMFIDIEKEFPNAKVLIIDRDMERAIAYDKEHYGSDCIPLIKDRLDTIKGKRIKFNEVKDNLEEIWDYLIGTEYDSFRGNLLKNLNIQVHFQFNEIAAMNLMTDLNARGESCRGL